MTESPPSGILRACQSVPDCGLLPGWYLRLCHHNASVRDIPFNVSHEWLNEIYVQCKQKCELTGLDIYLTEKRLAKEFNYRFTDYANTASLDRKNSKLSYELGNVQWVHKDVNRMKLIFSDEYFLEVATKHYNFCEANIKYNETLQVSPSTLKAMRTKILSRNDVSKGCYFTETDILELYRRQDGKCAITGEVLQLAKNCAAHRKSQKTASIDRISSTRGYYLENIQLLHKHVNLMKQIYSHQYFCHMLKLVYLYNKLKEKNINKQELEDYNFSKKVVEFAYKHHCRDTSLGIVTDLDATLVWHHGQIQDIVSNPPQLLPGIAEQLKIWKAIGCKIIIITARPEAIREITINHLTMLGIDYDQLIMGLPNGPRIMINDDHGKGKPTCYALEVEPNKGLWDLSSAKYRMVT